jgi:hypothetical protein
MSPDHNSWHGLKFALPISLIMWSLFIWLVLATLGGCAITPEARRGTLESFGAAIVVGTAVTMAERHKRHEPPGHVTIGTPNCGATPSLCQ